MNHKLRRDLFSVKAQIMAIILVMAAGIAVYIISFGVLDSLKLTRDTYYDHYQFADVFSSLKRAPNSVIRRIEEIPGVSRVEARVVFDVTLQMDNLDEPATGKLISVPNDHQPLLNQLYLRSGRYLLPDELNSVLADESFVQAHHLNLGDVVHIISNGHKRKLKIVGIVLSPEYVYSIAPGALMPDPIRFGVFWMNRRSLEASINMKGAFNDISIGLSRNANIRDVKDHIDRILKPYGGLISYGRDEQVSNFFVENELKQLNSMGMVAPFIFLSVAAFLINVVISRQIGTQREQIGMLKAIGYTNRELVFHYLNMVLVMILGGAVVGIALGTWMGSGMTQMYTEFFQFPILKYKFSYETIAFSVLLCSIAAISGALIAIQKVVNLAPAEAMRPERPLNYKHSFIDRLSTIKHLSFLTLMILRQIIRRPIRAFLSSLGVALSLSILIFSFFLKDSMSYLLDIQYDEVQREDISLAFVNSRPHRAIEELKALPGILAVEPIRVVPVLMKFKNYSKRSSITGLNFKSDLRQVIDINFQALTLPKHGIMLSDKIAKILHIKVGDILEIEVLDEKRKKIRLPVTAINQQYIGSGGYIEYRSLNHLLDNAPKVTGAMVQIDENYTALIYKKLKQIPVIIGLNIVSVLRQIFENVMAENLLMMISSNIMFASIISFGVIYNIARIALSERGRELANLRVLGMTRKEVSYLLFGELGFITLAAIPIGIVLGLGLAKAMVVSMDSELFRIPLYINNSTFGFAVMTILISMLLSFFLVWRQVEQIDLVTAQKGVE